MAKNEIVKANEFTVVTFDGDLSDSVIDEMDGLGSISFDNVRMPAAGSVAFELPGEDDDSPISTTEIVGVIVDHHPVNAYWGAEYGGSQAAAPDCSSLDGKRGNLGECASCPHNQYGSKGRGKACKNMHRLYLLTNGSPAPVIMSVPPTGIKALRDYFGKRLLLHGMLPHQVITKITAKKDMNNDGIAFSRLAFTFQDKLTPDQTEKIAGVRSMCKAMRQQVEVSSDDYAAPPKNPAPATAPPAPVDADGFMDIPDSLEEELPFN